jgi:hypothetical protein
MEQHQIGEEKIWVKFTYFDEDIRILTKIFRKSEATVAFSVNNTIKKKCDSNLRMDKYSQSGVYSLKVYLVTRSTWARQVGVLKHDMKNISVI